LFPCSRSPPALHSFPTRRSSDLRLSGRVQAHRPCLSPMRSLLALCEQISLRYLPPLPRSIGPHQRLDTSLCRTRSPSRLHRETLDRKSTRLNSSHVSISYAVFCL